MQVDRLSNPNTPKPSLAGNAEGVGGVAPTTDQTQAAPASDGQGDRVEISSEAQAAAKRSQDAANSDTEVRADKVAAARKFLEAGLYNDQGVIDRTAASLASYLKLEA